MERALLQTKFVAVTAWVLGAISLSGGSFAQAGPEETDPGAGLTLPLRTANGDTNADGERDMSDAVSLFNYLFLGGPAPAPAACPWEGFGVQNGDSNGDGGIDLSDAVSLLAWLFTGGPEPVPACSLLRQPGGGSGMTIHVAELGVTSWKEGTNTRRGRAVVVVHDDLGDPVPDVLVTGKWTGCTKSTGTGVTGADGTVLIIDTKIASCWGNKNCYFTFEVTNLEHPAFSYDPAANVLQKAFSLCRF